MPYSFAVKCGGWLGTASYYVAGKARRIAEQNLSRSYPDKTRKEICETARKVFCNQGKNLFELFSFPKLDKKDFERLVTFETRGNLEKAMQAGKGVFLASAHCGNWEIMGAALSLTGFPINVIARRVYIEGLNRMLVGFRSSKGVKVILRSGRESAREILRSVRQKECIGILIDQDTSVPGVFVDFFGRQAWTPSGLASLALRTGAAVVMALDMRMPGDTHKIILSEPVKLEVTGDTEKDIAVNTQAISRMIEAHIRLCPDQWVWMHERWKTRPQVPAGEAAS